MMLRVSGAVPVSMIIVFINNYSLILFLSKGQKHYSKQTVYDAHLTSKKHVKAAARQATSEAPPVNPNVVPPLAQGQPPPGGAPSRGRQPGGFSGHPGTFTGGSPYHILLAHKEQPRVVVPFYYLMGLKHLGYHKPLGIGPGIEGH